MHIDPGIVLAGAIVGFVVGMTGMGGGALMTPILVIFFGINPTRGRFLRPHRRDDHETDRRRRAHPAQDGPVAARQVALHRLDPDGVRRGVHRAQPGRRRAGGEHHQAVPRLDADPRLHSDDREGMDPGAALVGRAPRGSIPDRRPPPVRGAHPPDRHGRARRRVPGRADLGRLGLDRDHRLDAAVSDPSRRGTRRHGPRAGDSDGRRRPRSPTSWSATSNSR